MVKGAAGLRRCALLSTVRDLEAAAFERGLQALGGRLIGNVELVELLAVGGDKPRLEGLVLGRGELGQDRPVFLRLEPLDLELAVADEAERHRLHAAGGAGAWQLAPQHG